MKRKRPANFWSLNPKAACLRVYKRASPNMRLLLLQYLACYLFSRCRRCLEKRSLNNFAYCSPFRSFRWRWRWREQIFMTWMQWLLQRQHLKLPSLYLFLLVPCCKSVQFNSVVTELHCSSKHQWKGHSNADFRPLERKRQSSCNGTIQHATMVPELVAPFERQCLYWTVDA